MNQNGLKCQLRLSSIDGFHIFYFQCVLWAYGIGWMKLVIQLPLGLLAFIPLIVFWGLEQTQTFNVVYIFVWVFKPVPRMDWASLSLSLSLSLFLSLILSLTTTRLLVHSFVRSFIHSFSVLISFLPTLEHLCPLAVGLTLLEHNCRCLSRRVDKRQPITTTSLLYFLSNIRVCVCVCFVCFWILVAMLVLVWLLIYSRFFVFTQYRKTN